jgi:hypothetical protein
MVDTSNPDVVASYKATADGLELLRTQRKELLKNAVPRHLLDHLKDAVARLEREDKPVPIAICDKIAELTEKIVAEDRVLLEFAAAIRQQERKLAALTSQLIPGDRPALPPSPKPPRMFYPVDDGGKRGMLAVCGGDSDLHPM